MALPRVVRILGDYVYLDVWKYRETLQQRLRSASKARLALLIL